MIDDYYMDPLEIQNNRHDRQHIFRGLTVYQRVVKINDIDRAALGTLSNDERWESLELYRDNLQAELDAVSASLKARDSGALRRNACNVEVALHSLAYVGKLPLERDMLKTTDVLLTQFCMHDYDVEATTDHYRELGLNVYVTQDPTTEYRTVRSNSHQTDIEGRVYVKDQALKSMFYHDVEFNPTFK